MFMLLFRYVFGGAIAVPGINYVDFLTAGILVQNLAFGANYTTINLAVDLQQGIVDRFRSLPMATSALLVGHIVADLVRNFITGIIMLVVGLIVGFRPNASLEEWLLALALLVLFTLAISWLSAIMGLFVKSIEAAQWIGFVLIFPLTFASSAFAPTETMPRLLRIFAENQPVSHVVNAVRSWLVGYPPLGDSGWLAFVWSAGIVLVAMPLSVWIFSQRKK
jgi:ABC-type multidrug transport system permease subunit